MAKSFWTTLRNASIKLEASLGLTNFFSFKIVLTNIFILESWPHKFTVHLLRCCRFGSSLKLRQRSARLTAAKVIDLFVRMCSALHICSVEDLDRLCLYLFSHRLAKVARPWSPCLGSWWHSLRFVLLKLVCRQARHGYATLAWHRLRSGDPGAPPRLGCRTSEPLLGLTTALAWAHNSPRSKLTYVASSL